MRHLSRRNDHVPDPLWRRLERVAGEINPFLMALAIGLVALYLTCLIGLLIKLPITRIDSATCPLPPPATERIGAGGS
jgi:hypothetical protein